MAQLTIAPILCTLFAVEGDLVAAKDYASLNRCGPLALQLAALAVDRAVTREQIDRLLPPNGEESSLAELQKAAEELGLSTLCARWTKLPEEFSQAPAIVRIADQGGRWHFVVLLKRTRESVLVGNVPHRPYWISVKDLHDSVHWDGYALHIARDPEPVGRLRRQARHSSAPYLFALAAVLAVGSGLHFAHRRMTSLSARPRMVRPGPRAGLSLPEVLVAVGIVGIVVSLLLPAVLNSRERARTVHCRKRLAQLMQASSAHESAYGSFPVAPLSEPFSIHVALLPFLDQEPLYRSIDREEDGSGLTGEPPASSRNVEALRTAVTGFVCPSDAVRAGGNSFRACAGVTPQLHSTFPLDGSAAKSGAATASFAARFKDGLSNTVFFSEKLVGDERPERYTPRRDFFLTEGSFIRPSDAEQGCRLSAGAEPAHVSFGGATWLFNGYDHTWYNHISPPNASLPDCSAGRITSRSPYANGAVGGNFAARSLHPGGVNAVLGDGSARFVSETIDLNVWRALGSRQGGEAVSQEF